MWKSEERGRASRPLGVGNHGGQGTGGTGPGHRRRTRCISSDITTVGVDPERIKRFVFSGLAVILAIVVLALG